MTCFELWFHQTYQLLNSFDSQFQTYHENEHDYGLHFLLEVLANLDSKSKCILQFHDSTILKTIDYCVKHEVRLITTSCSSYKVNSPYFLFLVYLACYPELAVWAWASSHSHIPSSWTVWASRSTFLGLKVSGCLRASWTHVHQNLNDFQNHFYLQVGWLQLFHPVS